MLTTAFAHPEEPRIYRRPKVVFRGKPKPPPRPKQTSKLLALPEELLLLILSFFSVEELMKARHSCRSLWLLSEHIQFPHFSLKGTRLLQLLKTQKTLQSLSVESVPRLDWYIGTLPELTYFRKGTTFEFTRYYPSVQILIATQADLLGDNILRFLPNLRVLIIDNFQAFLQLDLNQCPHLQIVVLRCESSAFAFPGQLHLPELRVLLATAVGTKQTMTLFAPFLQIYACYTPPHEIIDGVYYHPRTHLFERDMSQYVSKYIKIMTERYRISRGEKKNA